MHGREKEGRKSEKEDRKKEIRKHGWMEKL